jgi:2-methylcitrate dehydratase PrpD
MNESRKLAAFAANLKFEALPPALVQRAKILLLDHFGVSLFASETPWGKIAKKSALRFSCLPESTLYGSSTPVAAEYAALANGTAAHGYELDDSHEGGYSHPGAPVIPAAFGVAEPLGSSGADLLLAIIVGYEIMGRVGNALGAEGIKQHHPTGQTGVFGAVTAASKIQSATEEQLLNALGIAGSMASGIMQFADDSEGAMVKRLHGGWPAHGGIVASRLALDGFTGPARVLEGRFGFLRSITERFDVAPLTANLGDTWELMRTAVKLYPTCRAHHPMIEAIERLKAKHDVAPNRIKEITVGTTSKALSQQMIYAPASFMSAQYSLPFTAAWALHRETSDPRGLTEETMSDGQILATASKVKAHLDERFDKSYPRYAVTIRVTTVDGVAYDEEVWDAKGSSEKPASNDDLIRKFVNVTDGIIAKPQAVVDEILLLEEKTSLASLSAALRDVRR